MAMTQLKCQFSRMGDDFKIIFYVVDPNSWTPEELVAGLKKAVDDSLDDIRECLPPAPKPEDVIDAFVDRIKGEISPDVFSDTMDLLGKVLAKYHPGCTCDCAADKAAQSKPKAAKPKHTRTRAKKADAPAAAPLGKDGKPLKGAALAQVLKKREKNNISKQEGDMPCMKGNKGGKPAEPAKKPEGKKPPKGDARKAGKK